MSTLIKKISFQKESDFKSIDPFKVFWEANDTEGFLLISIHDESADPGATPENIGLSRKQFGIRVNNAAFKDLIIPDDQIVIQPMRRLSNLNEAIYQATLDYDDLKIGKNTVSLFQEDAGTNILISKSSFTVRQENSSTNVTLQRPGIEPTTDQILWAAIKSHSLKFQEYENFIDLIICKDDDDIFSGKRRKHSKIRSPFIKSEEYNLIKFATDFYMLDRFGLDPDELKGYLGISNKLPYYDLVIQRIKDDLSFDTTSVPAGSTADDCEKRESERLFNPFMIELIWSYWMEQGMLVQTLNVINLRFQNMKGNLYMDKLQRFDVDPLRPLSHILWGYIQDEQHRLAIPRRANEYDHEYGLLLTGRAVPRLKPVDSRVQFLETFHNLLNLCTIYFHESDDTTRIADAFPILNSLKDVHLQLAEGNHNAYGNLTWTARQEMLMQQYILARTEMREFLGGKVMVPYPETWMDRVDTMRNIQGWGTVGIVHYYELAVHGELILLSIRYGNWSDVTLDRTNAANWAQEFRNSIQRYIHAYRAVTGVDLSADQVQHSENFSIQPAYLIQQRLYTDRSRTRRA